MLCLCDARGSRNALLYRIVIQYVDIVTSFIWYTQGVMNEIFGEIQQENKNR